MVNRRIIAVIAGMTSIMMEGYIMPPQRLREDDTRLTRLTCAGSITTWIISANERTYTKSRVYK